MELKDVEKLTELARLEMSDGEKQAMLSDFGSILKYIGQIEEANVPVKQGLGEEVVQTLTSLQTRRGQPVNIFREDDKPHEAGIFTDDLLTLAPQKQDGYIKVKKILS